MGDIYSSLFENLYGLDLSDYIWTSVRDKGKGLEIW